MISFVIPTLEEEKVIEKLLKNLKQITTFDYEIIVSDGGSKDLTVEIARRYADKVVVHDGKTRQNIAQGRNAGAAVAKGEFLVFLDADGFIPKPNEFFLVALTEFDNPKVVALTVNIRVYPDQETFGDKLVFGIMVNVGQRFKNNVLHVGEATGEFQMIKKSAFDFLKGFREDLITREDADMFFRLSKIGLTRFNSHLTLFHSGRRAHKVGWVKLLSIWTINTIWVALFNKAVSKEWKVIR